MALAFPTRLGEVGARAGSHVPGGDPGRGAGPAAGDAPEKSEKAAGGKRARVLVIDDEPMILEKPFELQRLYAVIQEVAAKSSG
jgi:hypothetical protein